MKLFIKKTHVEKAGKIIKSEATFKIEMNENEKMNRDKYGQSIYHTVNKEGIDINNWAAS